jgi:hypothetical protein
VRRAASAETILLLPLLLVLLLLLPPLRCHVHSEYLVAPVANPVTVNPNVGKSGSPYEK